MIKGQDNRFLAHAKETADVDDDLFYLTVICDDQFANLTYDRVIRVVDSRTFESFRRKFYGGRCGVAMLSW